MKTIHVKYSGFGSLISVGRLVLNDRKILFEYFPEFIETKIELSPYHLPLKSGVMICKENVFDGLFGVFHDSLPDGWGRLLLDRKISKMGKHLTALDRLQYVGAHGMGALVYEPEEPGNVQILGFENLDTISGECEKFQEDQGDEFIDHLLGKNGSLGGVRPKIIVEMDKPHTQWIIKFRAQQDSKDIGSIEYAYHLMAKNAGLEVPESKLFPSKKCSGYFGVQRFDREKENERPIHMHTVSGLLHADHRVPSLDYETLIKATHWLTKDIRESEKMFRNCVFNVFAHNRDDHAKNFSFLMDSEGIWRVSPAYDLTFSNGPSGEHCTMVMGEGKNPKISHLLKLAEISSIKKMKAQEIIEQVKASVAQWSKFANEANVNPKSIQQIQNTLNNSQK